MMKTFLKLLPPVISGLVDRISRDERQRTPLGLGQIRVSRLTLVKYRIRQCTISYSETKPKDRRNRITDLERKLEEIEEP